MIDITRTVPAIIASGGVTGLIYFGQWVGALLIAITVILWLTALHVEHRS